jgi:hypothetical protein
MDHPKHMVRVIAVFLGEDGQGVRLDSTIVMSDEILPAIAARSAGMNRIHWDKAAAIIVVSPNLGFEYFTQEELWPDDFKDD